MRTPTRAILALLALLAVAGPAAAEPPKDTMVIGLVAEPVTMDPPQITDLNSTRVAKRIFEGLTAQELGSYKIVPGLARSWDISKDGLVYTDRAPQAGTELQAPPELRPGADAGGAALASRAGRSPTTPRADMGEARTGSRRWPATADQLLTPPTGGPPGAGGETAGRGAGGT
jgi:hypothetical protein